jgi:hypothetical protein
MPMTFQKRFFFTVFFSEFRVLSKTRNSFVWFVPSKFHQREELIPIKMAGDHRVTLRRRHAYRTNSNRVKTILTPGRLEETSCLENTDRSFFFSALIRW